MGLLSVEGRASLVRTKSRCVSLIGLEAAIHRDGDVAGAEGHFLTRPEIRLRHRRANGSKGPDGLIIRADGPEFSRRQRNPATELAHGCEGVKIFKVYRAGEACLRRTQVL